MAKSLSADVGRHLVDWIEAGLSCRFGTSHFGVSGSCSIHWVPRNR